MIELNINNLLEDKNLTAEECAEKAGIATPIFNQIKDGQLSPTLENIESIAKALGVEPIELIPSFVKNESPAVVSDKAKDGKKDLIILCTDCGCRINRETAQKI